jgi:hypothetical protein
MNTECFVLISPSPRGCSRHFSILYPDSLQAIPSSFCVLVLVQEWSIEYFTVLVRIPLLLRA